MNNATPTSKIRSFSTGISPGRVTADFFTDSHRFSASVVVYKRHLVDVLGDRMTDFLDLVDVYVSLNNNPNEIVHTSRQCRVNFGKLLSVILMAANIIKSGRVMRCCL